MNTEPFNEKKTGIKEFLESNSKILLSTITAVVLFIAVFFWFDHSKKEKRVNIAEDYIEAKVLLMNNNKSKSYEVLRKIILKEDQIYSPLSLFLIIDQDLETNKEIIIEYFDNILSIKNIEKEDLNLLRLKKAIFISPESNEQDILNLLNPVINTDSVWKNQSLKFIGDYFFSLNQFKKASQYYSILLDTDDENIDLNDIKRKMKLIKND